MIPKQKNLNEITLKWIPIAFIIITLIFFITLVVFAKIVNDVKTIASENRALLVIGNKHISEIKELELKECESRTNRVFESIKPFIPTHPQTKKQIKEIDTFNSAVIKFTNECKNEERSER